MQTPNRPEIDEFRRWVNWNSNEYSTLTRNRQKEKNSVVNEVRCMRDEDKMGYDEKVLILQQLAAQVKVEIRLRDGLSPV